jgi:NAD(P)-dependent dehydrogenase (short-subunit alcohol dehydrogenase family)
MAMVISDWMRLARARRRGFGRVIYPWPSHDETDETVARFGQLDVAFNNAGTLGTPGLLTEQSAESYAAIFDTNVLGLVLSMKHELRVMQAQRHGSIVNLSSIVGHKALPGDPLYVASKHAVEGLTKAAALEAVAFGVRVNAVAPGPIATEMLEQLASDADARAALIATVPLGRPGTPDEVVRIIMLLASEQASFVTGGSCRSTVVSPHSKRRWICVTVIGGSAGHRLPGWCR